MDADLDTLATALYVTTDDLLKESPQLAPYRPEVGIDPKLATPNWSPLPSCRPYWGSPPRPGG